MAKTATRPPQLAAYLAPSDIARSRGVNVVKILDFIKSGELRATNYAASQCGKLPRWRVSPADLEAFDAARAAVPRPTPSRQKQRPRGHVVEFF